MKVSYPEIDKLFEQADSKTFAQAMNNGTMPAKPTKKASVKKAPVKKAVAKKK